MHKVVTPSGLVFYAESGVKIGDMYYPIEELNDTQREYLAAKLNVQGWNAAYAGQVRFDAAGLGNFADVFPAHEATALGHNKTDRAPRRIKEK